MRFKDKGDFGTLSTFVKPARKAVVMRTSTVEKVDESGEVTQPKGVKIETEVPGQVHPLPYGEIQQLLHSLLHSLHGHGCSAAAAACCCGQPKTLSPQQAQQATAPSLPRSLTRATAPQQHHPPPPTITIGVISGGRPRQPSNLALARYA